MAQLFDQGIFSVIASNSTIGAGWTLGWFLAGTTTLTNSFTDSTLTTANANPVVANSNGRFAQMWLGAGNYKYVLKDNLGNTIVTVDNYNVPTAVPTITSALNSFLAGTTPLPILNGGTGQTTAANAIGALGGLPTAGGTMTGNIVRSSKGVHVYWDTAAMNNGGMFITTAASSDPTTLAGQVWFKY